jgi:uridine kinase
MYEGYIEPTREFADLVVDGERPLEESLGAMLARVYPQA